MATPPPATVASSSPEVQGLCNYYARTHYYRHIQTVCNEFLKKKPNSDPALVFWRAYGAMREGSINDAIRDLESIRRDGEMLFPVLVALRHAHKLSKIVDTDEVSRIEGFLEREQGRVNERGLFQAAQFCWHADRLDDARTYVDWLLAMKPRSQQGSILRCWIELTSGGAAELEPEAWDEGGGRNELEALMGKAKQFEVTEQYSLALENLNQVIVRYAWFLPALAEKAKVMMMMGDWEQAVEAAQRVLLADQHNIEALRITVLFLLSQDAKYQTAQQRISDLLDAIDRHEPRNASLYDSVSRPFARIAGRHPGVLRLTLALIDRACKLAPTTAAYAVEKGYQLTLLRDFTAAVATYREAHKLDEADSPSMLGQIRCQVYQGQLREAASQLEFIKEIQTMSADLAFVSALVAAHHDGEKGRAVALLDQALELHMTQLRSQPYDVTYFEKLNPDFLVELAREYVDHVGTEPEVLEAGSLEALAISKALKLLDIVRKQVPGLLDGQMLLARAKFLSQDFDAALRLLSQCTRADPSYAPASLLHAQILLRQEQPKAAQSVLEAALAHNFEVRESVLYHVVRARCLALDDNLGEALQVLQGAMRLPGVKAGTVSRGQPPPAHDRCTLYLQLVDVLLRLERTDQAGKVMHEAISLFNGTPQEGRITVANCELLLKKGEVEGALAILRNIGQENPHFMKAKRMLADLYLKYRNDRRMYCICHEELVKAIPSVATYVALGEAYMNVQEPDKAIPAFEQALKRSPKDALLASRIGKALVSTHDYVRAIDYYQAAIASDPGKASLKYELAELYLKLRKYDLAQEALEEVLDGAGAITGSGNSLIAADRAGERHTHELARDVQAWLMLARLLKDKDMLKPAVEALYKARNCQERVVQQVQAEAPDSLPEHKEKLSTICIHLAQFHVHQRDHDTALSHFNEALKHEPSSVKATLALAKLYLLRGELDQCQHQCVTLMKLDPDNIDASMMLADLMLRKAEYDAAIYHFEQLLEKDPTHYHALHKLILLLRHAGRLTDAEPFVKRSHTANARASKRMGLHVCSGLLARYLNDPHKALQQLNSARKDSEWGELAVTNMIEIYINGENIIDWADETGEGAINTDDVNTDNIAAAEKLLRELQPSKKQKVLECLVLIAYKSRPNVEGAISRILEILQGDQDYVPALVAVSIGHLVLKQTPKARNHLKRLAKMSYQSEFASEFELGWLMLAHVYIQGGKYDLAEELCTRCLGANRSCARAYELLGQVKEKELSYRDAASAYELAWQLEREASATVGYKLAFNLLKAKEYVPAIDVCQKVLTTYPDYPRIQKEILDKARSSLRM